MSKIVYDCGDFCAVAKRFGIEYEESRRFYFIHIRATCELNTVDYLRKDVESNDYEYPEWVKKTLLGLLEDEWEFSYITFGRE